MTLAQGDIVIIGMDAESWDRIAVLATRDLDPGEVNIIGETNGITNVW